MASQVQSKNNHVRFDPAFHFVLLPLLLGMLLWTIVRLIRHPGQTPAIQLVLLALFTLLTLKMRGYSLKVQDRLIRLEERLRLTSILDPSLHPEILRLSERQLIALRFASDAELASLAQRTWSEDLTPAQIKESIKDWRADHFRV